MVVEVNRITQLVQSSTSNHVKPDSKWIKKVSNKCLVIRNALLVIKVNVWHLNNVGYRHMTREWSCQITENGAVNIPYLPQLKNVNYVDGLKSSLISMYKLCDKVADEVSLSKEGYQIVNNFGKNMLVLKVQ